MTDQVNFSGVIVDNISLAEAAIKAELFISSKQPHLIVTPNPELIVAAQTDQEIKNIINAADLRVPDGISLVVVSRILGFPLKERVTGIDLLLKLAQLSGRKGYRIFLFGGAPGIAEAAAGKLKAKYSADIVGFENGFTSDDSAIVKKIQAAKPDILFVGLGGGRQERWLNRHLKDLNVPVALAVGGSFDVISGQKKRAPQWAQSLYIEWLYRLFTEPNRWKRQLALPKFLWLMFRPH